MEGIHNRGYRNSFNEITIISEPKTPEIAVKVENLHYHFGRGRTEVKALDGVSICVPKGQIYAVLGPSGCGKTTLMHCLMGNLTPRKGASIQIFNSKPGSSSSLVPGPGVGYMPQELGLFFELTVEETLLFFGRINRMETESIKTRMNFLLDFLDITDQLKKLTRNLSGGQQRRVSLATALIHNPPLLILDEPTVGVDPVLRNNIWSHLVALSGSGITTIITTHYIEEARSANIVGFMRNGRLLEEGHPDELMDKRRVDSLEKIFLMLCSKNQNNSTSDSDSVCNGISKTKSNKLFTSSTLYPTLEPSNCNDLELPKNNFPLTQQEVKKHKTFFDSLMIILVLLVKNVQRQYRNLPSFILTIILPSLQMVLVLTCIGRDLNQIPIAVNDLDNNTFSKMFINCLNNKTSSKINAIRVATLDEAVNGTREGRYRGAIAFSPKFTTSLGKLMMMVDAGGFMRQRDIIINLTKEARLEIFADQTEQFFTLTFYETVKEAFFCFLSKFLKGVGMTDDIIPIKLTSLYGGDDRPPITEWLAPGFMVSLLFFGILAASGTVLVLEKKCGVLDRLFVAGVKPYELICSHFFTNILLSLFQILIISIITFFAFSIPCRGQHILVVSIFFLIGLTGMSLGLLISSICSNENTAFVMCSGFMMISIIISGAIWPVEAMPTPFLWLSRAFSMSHSIEAARAVMYRQWDLTYLPVILALVSNVAWTFIFLVAASIAFAIKKAH